MLTGVQRGVELLPVCALAHAANIMMFPVHCHFWAGPHKCRVLEWVPNGCFAIPWLKKFSLRLMPWTRQASIEKPRQHGSGDIVFCSFLVHMVAPV